LNSAIENMHHNFSTLQNPKNILKMQER